MNSAFIKALARRHDCMISSLKQQAYSLILRKLSNGELPAGARVSNRALAKELDIGFVPVREAIIRLVSEGLVEHRPGQGTFVPEPSNEKIIDLYDLREALECHAVAKLAAQAGRLDLSEAESQNRQLWEIIEELSRQGSDTCDAEQLDRWGHADAAFHGALLRAAGNRLALERVLDLRLLTRIFSQGMQHQPTATLVRTHEEHQRIVAALAQGDADAARREMSAHIRYGCRMILAAHDRRRMELVSAHRLRPLGVR